MAACVFPFNPVLRAMTYASGVLSLEFKKKTGVERRMYSEVPQEVAYKLFYSKTGADVLAFFSKNIKQKYKVIDIRKI